MPDIFRLLTPATYWVLIVLWSFILCFYFRKMWQSTTKQLFLPLIIILAIDAFRTLFESIYFGFWYTSLAGLIPKNVSTFLMRPEVVIVPKILNVIAALIVIFILLKRWLPMEEEKKVSVKLALQESENKYRALFENSNAAIFIYDPETMIISDANHAATDLYGYSHEELIGMKCLDLSAEIEKSKQAANEAIENGNVNVKLRWHKKKDGTFFPVEIDAYSIVLNEYPCGYAVVVDITKRIKIEEDLKVQKKLLDRSQELAHIGSWHLDIKNNILTWSDEEYRIFGRTQQNFGATYEAFLATIHPDDREMVDKTYSTAIKNNLPYECIHRIIRDDGEVRIVLEKSEDVSDENGNIIHSFGFTQDITELKVIEKHYRSEKQKSEKFLEIAGFMVVSLNAKGEISLINNKGCQILNIKEDEAIGKNWFDQFLPKRMVSEVKEVFGKSMAGDIQPVEYCENPILTSDGEERLIAFRNTILTDENGNIDGILFSGEDITDRKQAEETFQAIVRSTVGNTGQQLFDTICTQVCSVFKSECTIVGELVDDTTINAVAMFLDGSPIKNFSYQLSGTPCERAINSGFCHFPKDIIHLFPDAKDIQSIDAIGYAGIPLRNHQKKVVGVLCTISKNQMTIPRGAEDLLRIIATRASAEIERMKDEREKDQMENRLQQAQKMEAIGTLAGGIAHDFNNILAVILGYSDMAKEDAPSGTKYQKDLEKISIAANRAKDLVKQILAFSRQAQVDRMPIKIQSLVKEGLKMLRSSIPTTISITENIDPKSGTILADPTQVHQILLNLCTNAYHAMESTGGELSVAIKTAVIAADDRKTPGPVAAPGEYIELTVTDTGVGIRPDITEKIFDPYFTTKDSGKGTGLGLAIIHGIIKEYGGAITVDSQLGKGSTFHVYFPVIEEGAVPKLEEPGDIPIGKERILFVDDEEFLAEMGKDMLERLGYHVTVRRNSVEALTTFQNTPNEFDAVITDQTMPDMTGSDLARRMMQIRPDIPIILCTGYSNLIDETSAKALGIKEFALKPLTKEVVANLIRKVLDT